MQRNVQICMHAQHAHAHTPVQASGPSAHKSGAGALPHRSSSHIHMHALAVTFRPRLQHTRSLLRNAEKPATLTLTLTPAPTDNAHLKDGEGPLEGP